MLIVVALAGSSYINLNNVFCVKSEQVTRVKIITFLLCPRCSLIWWKSFFTTYLVILHHLVLRPHLAVYLFVRTSEEQAWRRLMLFWAIRRFE